MAVSLNKQFGLSFGKIATVFRTRFGLHVTPSALVRALHRASAKGQPTYAALCQTVRTSPVVVPDETGWKVRGLLYWLWVFATTTTTVYRIARGRGFDDAASGLTRDEPFLTRAMISERTVVCCAGSYQEIADDIVQASECIVVDDWAGCSKRGNLAAMVRRGALTRSSVRMELQAD